MMRREDLKTVSEISRAFWIEPSRSEQMALESFTAASLLDTTDERKLEKAASALLERASRGGMAANARANLAAINEPFFRLAPEERFALVALHVGHWSYARLSRILKRAPEDVDALVWQ